MQLIKYFLLFVFCIFLAFILTLYKLELQTNTDEIQTEYKSDKPILILHWSKAYDKYIFDNEDLTKCSKPCEVTTSKKRALEADAITFYGMHPLMKRFRNKLSDLRRVKSKATFIFHSREPPTLTLALGKVFRKFSKILWNTQCTQLHSNTTKCTKLHEIHFDLNKYLD